jgi:adenine phosphoribosyltransferase
MTETMTLEELRARVRDVPDFPKPGIVFKDLTPLMADGAAFRAAQDMLGERVAAHRPDVIVGIESRGFIFATAVAVRLGVGFVPVRKPGKLPWRKHRVEYALEYGTDALEMHEDALLAGHRAVIIDDLLATGGTAAATVKLVEGQGARVLATAFVVELGFLNGRDRLAPVPVDALLVF